MKKIIFILILAVSLLFVSCATLSKNSEKIEISSLIKDTGVLYSSSDFSFFFKDGSLEKETEKFKRINFVFSDDVLTGTVEANKKLLFYNSKYFRKLGFSETKEADGFVYYSIPGTNLKFVLDNKEQIFFTTGNITEEYRIALENSADVFDSVLTQQIESCTNCVYSLHPGDFSVRFLHFLPSTVENINYYFFVRNEDKYDFVFETKDDLTAQNISIMFRTNYYSLQVSDGISVQTELEDSFYLKNNIFKATNLDFNDVMKDDLNIITEEIIKLIYGENKE